MLTQQKLEKWVKSVCGKAYPYFHLSEQKGPDNRIEVLLYKVPSVKGQKSHLAHAQIALGQQTALVGSHTRAKATKKEVTLFKI